MTRARALKQVIRARAARTGERYTTARRHILRELNDAPKAPQAPKARQVPTKGSLSDAKSIKALEAGLKDPKSKGFVMKPDGQARYRFKWDGMTVQFNLYPKGPGKTSVGQYRTLWKTAFAAIAETI